MPSVLLEVQEPILQITGVIFTDLMTIHEQLFLEAIISNMGYYRGCRESVVGIKTGYGLDDRGVGVRVSVR
jgi:hypothetical protein